jgi:2',3'-cyclic-nucleotide 2'-phosphodiesterase (5'-nucleotidase family)
MLARRLRLAGLLVSVSVASMLAVASIWAAGAESKPTLEDRTANIQLLGINDFHGNLEPPRQVNGRTVSAAADVDYINTDNLAALEKFLLANDPQPIEHFIYWNGSAVR